MKNKPLFKTLILATLVIILSFQFQSSFKNLTNIVESNQVYTQINSNGIQKEMINLNNIITLDSQKERTIQYVKVSTLQIYTYKLFQTILLLFGIFMCIIFMATNNKEFSLVEILSERKK